MQKKYTSIQILRAFAAWLVVYHHFMQVFFNFKSETAVGAFFSTHGSLGVDIFFVLSGFVMYQSAMATESPRRFAVARLFRIVPTYWFYTALIIACIAFFPTEFYYTRYNAESLIKSLLFQPSENASGIGMYPPLTVGWTLNFEFFFYLLLSVCLFISKRFGLLICTVLLATLPSLLPSPSLPLRVLFSPLLHEFVAGIVIGFLFSNKVTTDIIEAHKKAIFIVLAICLYFVLARLALGLHYKIAMSGLVLALFLLLEKPLSALPFASLLTKLGDISFSTYLVHTIVFGVFIHFSGVITGPTDTILLLIVVTIIVYFASLLSYNYIETNRYLGNLRDRLAGKKTPRLPDAVPASVNS